MAKLRMAHASTHGARKPPGPKFWAVGSGFELVGFRKYWAGSFHRLRRKIQKVSSSGETGNFIQGSTTRFWAACSFTNTVGRPEGCQRASGKSHWEGLLAETFVLRWRFHLSMTKQMSRWNYPLAEATRGQVAGRLVLGGVGCQDCWGEVSCSLLPMDCIHTLPLWGPKSGQMHHGKLNRACRLGWPVKNTITTELIY